jgi:hypothetical protein
MGYYVYLVFDIQWAPDSEKIKLYYKIVVLQTSVKGYYVFFIKKKVIENGGSICMVFLTVRSGTPRQCP